MVRIKLIKKKIESFFCKLIICHLQYDVYVILQVMVPYDYPDFIKILTSLVENKVIPMSRINDAVERILRVKFVMGLFENPIADTSFVDQLGKKV